MREVAGVEALYFHEAAANRVNRPVPPPFRSPTKFGG